MLIPVVRIDIKSRILPGDYIVAADGGMKTLEKAGVVPDLFIGDFDSYKGSIPEGTEIIKLNVRKDDTDSMHCASVAVERGFKSVVLLGASGGNPSHTFSNYSVLSFLSDSGVSAVMEDKDESVAVLCKGNYSFDNMNGFGFSLFPFGCKSVTVSYFGEADYPASDLIIEENSSLGKSNVIKSVCFEIQIKSGKAIVFYSSQKQ